MAAAAYLGRAGPQTGVAGPGATPRASFRWDSSQHNRSLQPATLCPLGLYSQCFEHDVPLTSYPRGQGRPDRAAPRLRPEGRRALSAVQVDRVQLPRGRPAAAAGPARARDRVLRHRDAASAVGLGAQGHDRGRRQQRRYRFLAPVAAAAGPAVTHRVCKRPPIQCANVSMCICTNVHLYPRPPIFHRRGYETRNVDFRT